MSPPPVFTVGHSTRTLPDFLALLAAHGIEGVVDVRRFPGSRRHPHFSHDALSEALAASEIGYRHEPDLGGRRRPRPESRNTAWRNASFRAYADHMESAEFRQALARLVERAARRPTTVLCAEAVPWRCHRRLIADALTVRGHQVRHILDPGRAEIHRLDPNAVVLPGGDLAYPAPGDGQGTLFSTG